MSFRLTEEAIMRDATIRSNLRAIQDYNAEIDRFERELRAGMITFTEYIGLVRYYQARIRESQRNLEYYTRT